MKNKTNIFLVPYGFRNKLQEQALLVKKKRTRILKKISPKNIPLGYVIRKKFIPDPDPGGKKLPDPGSRISDPGSGSATLIPINGCAI
jgi:hypothetical protein